MAKPAVWVGCGAGFAGDRYDAAVPVVKTLAKHSGPKYLIYEVMGERTLAIAQRLKAEDPSSGYSPWLDSYLPQVLHSCKQSGVRIVANFGNANPAAAASRVHQLAENAGVSGLRVAYVEGDDLLANCSAAELLSLPTLEGTATADRELLAANAYLGARPVADALALGVDVVLVGRTTDAALVLGPLMHEFGWQPDQYDLLACGTVAGHLLECGAQVTGGYFADPGLKQVPGLHQLGFPVAEVDQSGGIVLTKADNSGGLVSSATVIEQLLYEVHDPFNYLTPDVVVDYTDLEVLELAANRVRISGAAGRPPPATLKATLSVDGGWLGEAEISYAGPNALGRATLAADVIRRRCADIGITETCRVEILGAGAVHDNDNSTHPRSAHLVENGEYRVRAAVRSASRKTATQVSNEVLALYCCGPAAGGGVRQAVSPQVSTASILIERSKVEPYAKAIELRR